jgi:hypothetical protein
MELEENPLYRRTHAEVMGLLGAQEEEPMNGGFSPPNVVTTPASFDPRQKAEWSACIAPIRD